MNKSLMLTCVMLPVIVSSQEKPPVCESDYTTVIAGDTIEINVLENDWWMEGHQVEILGIGGATGGYVSFGDSTIRFEAYYYYEGIDSVGYKIKDNTNGMISEFGYLVVSVDNPGKCLLESGNIRAMINAYNFQFCDLTDYSTWFEVPAGGGVSSIFNMTLWMGGFNEQIELHLAAERYRQLGEDFFPGPISQSYNPGYFIDWNRVWENNRSELEYHRHNWNHSGYEIPLSISTWPALGDVAAGQADRLAPFIDTDHDGEYNPSLGDFPAVRGDRNVFFITNDDFQDHTESGGQQLGVEILGQAYNYDCPADSVFHNTLFMYYQIINRSINNYNDFYVGINIDFDLGNPWDDFIGCDSTLDLFFVYNGDNDDNLLVPFFSNSYGFMPPAQGAVILNHKLNSFIGSWQATGPYTYPTTPPEYYQFLQGRWRDGSPILLDGGDSTSFLYSGDPLVPGSFSEITAGNLPGDRRGVGAIGPFEFGKGDTLFVDLALLFARDYLGDHLSSLALLKERAAILRWYYENDSTPCGSAWSDIPFGHNPAEDMMIFPNPAGSFIQVNIGKPGIPGEYSIYSLDGRRTGQHRLTSGGAIDVSGLARGMYILRIISEDHIYQARFIKSDE